MNKKFIFVQNVVDVFSEDKSKLERIYNKVKAMIDQEQKSRLGQSLYPIIVEFWFEIELDTKGIYRFDENEDTYAFSFSFETKHKQSERQLLELHKRLGVDVLNWYYCDELNLFGESHYTDDTQENFVIEEDEYLLAKLSSEDGDMHTVLAELIVEKIKKQISDSLCKN
jgi:hypothetical protein